MKYDLHIHTNLSKCSILKPEKIIKIAIKKGLDGIAITDHNTIKAALKIKSKEIDIIAGCEIMTDNGEILAYYLQEDIRKRDFFEAIDEIKKQDGIIAVPHPFRYSGNFKFPIEGLKGKIDAIEVFNSRNLPGSNYLALREAKKNNFAAIGGSDAHFGFDIGRGYTLFEGDLRKAIKSKKTSVGGTIFLGWLSGSLSFLIKRIRTIRNS